MFRLSDAIVDGELSSAAEGKSDTRALYSDLLAGSSSSSSANEVAAFLEGIRTSHLAGHITLESPQPISHPATLRGFSIVP
jgi:hypothetical protein